jgi:pyruvate carboxylase
MLCRSVNGSLDGLSALDMSAGPVSVYVRVTDELTAEDEVALATPGLKRQATLNRLLFPGPTKEFETHRELYGDTSTLSATSSSTDYATATNTVLSWNVALNC